MYKPGQPEFLFTPDAFRAAQEQGAYELTYSTFHMKEINKLTSQGGLGRLQAAPGDMTFILSHSTDFHDRRYSESPDSQLFIPAEQLHGADYAPEVAKKVLERTNRPVLEIQTDVFTGSLSPALARAIMDLPPERNNDTLAERVARRWNIGKRGAIHEVLRQSQVRCFDAVYIRTERSTA